MTILWLMTTTRRSSAAVREDLLKAAGYLFARRGYAGASTKEIAQLAGTYETSLYTHFGSKAGIFSAAVIEPFTEFVQSFRATLTQQQGASEDVLIAAFVDDLYDSLESHHDAVMAFVLGMREPDAAEAVSGVQDSLAEMFDALHAAGRNRDAKAGRPGPGRPVVQRLMIGLVVAASAFAPWLFAGEDADPATIKRAMTEILVSGVRTEDR